MDSIIERLKRYTEEQRRLWAQEEKELELLLNATQRLQSWVKANKQKQPA